MQSGSGSFRIGTGAGFSADRLEPAVDLVARGSLDALVLECLGERTVAYGHRDRIANPVRGYNPWLDLRMRALLPVCRKENTVLITNMGAANPRAASERTLELARELGLKGMRIACIEGDDVSNLVSPDQNLADESATLADVGLPIVGMNAYLGADAILPALVAGADVIIGGRLADPSMFLAPLMHRLGWGDNDLSRLGAGTLVGHLLECGMQVTGGYFADPGVKTVSDLAHCGYPIAVVEPDGSAIITKLPGTGGCVSMATVKEQLLYEVHDPSCYLTPDVTADFSKVCLAQVGADCVRITNAGGSRKPSTLKVTVGFNGGFQGEAGISYAGVGAQERAQLAREILLERLRHTHRLEARHRIDLIGVRSLFATLGEGPITDTQDVRVQAVLRSASRAEAELLLWEVESLLCCGPAGGGGFRGSIQPCVVTKSVFIDRVLVRPTIEILVS